MPGEGMKKPPISGGLSHLLPVCLSQFLITEETFWVELLRGNGPKRVCRSPFTTLTDRGALARHAHDAKRHEPHTQLCGHEEPIPYARDVHLVTSPVAL